MTKGTTTTLTFAIDKVTPGAVRYQELDEQGRERDIKRGALISTIYIRKTAFKGDVIPNRITVTVTPE